MRWFILGLVALLVTACTTATPIPPTPVNPPLAVTFHVWATDGQDVTCELVVNDFDSDVVFAQLTGQPDARFGVFNPQTGLPCGIVPMATDNKTILLEDWEVTVTNNGATPKEVSGIMLDPGESMKWGSKNNG